MKKDTVLVFIIAAALFVIAFQTVQLVDVTNTVKTGVVTALESSQGGSSQSYDQMMQEMHPDQVQRPTGTTQIGGC